LPDPARGRDPHATPATPGPASGRPRHGLPGNCQPHARRAARTPGAGLIPAHSQEAAVTVIPAGHQADGPSIACVYDYLLGGSHNFAAD
jgi:hypothetical protein